MRIAQQRRWWTHHLLQLVTGDKRTFRRMRLIQFLWRIPVHDIRKGRAEWGRLAVAEHRGLCWQIRGLQVLAPSFTGHGKDRRLRVSHARSTLVREQGIKTKFQGTPGKERCLAPGTTALCCNPHSLDVSGVSSTWNECSRVGGPFQEVTPSTLLQSCSVTVFDSRSNWWKTCAGRYFSLGETG